jgi:hypothetical protein
MTIQPIVTEYKGNRFRSRLEARWAALFDLARLPYIYEPNDMGSYIPDFLIPGQRPVYVEVGPVLTEEEYVAKAAKPLATLTGYDFMVVGTDPLARQLRGSNTTIGMHWQWFADGDETGHSQALAVIGFCTKHGDPGMNPGCGQGFVVNDTMWFVKSPCGDYNGGSWHDELCRDDVERMWAEAGRVVQWNPRMRI